MNTMTTLLRKRHCGERFTLVEESYIYEGCFSGRHIYSRLLGFSYSSWNIWLLDGIPDPLNCPILDGFHLLCLSCHAPVCLEGMGGALY